jgi:prepilin-type N-terminal cleavage/methylation domain-containing protein
MRRGSSTAGSSTARRSRGGYTLIEVMMAIAVMTVGAVGIMALQSATVVGTREANEHSIATEATRTWLERLRQDSLFWQTSGPAGLATTEFLNTIPVGPNTAGEWHTPLPAVADRSYGFDSFGSDTTTAGEMKYCTNVRYMWLSGQGAIRVDVRTWWHRTHGNDAITDLTLFAGCNPADAAPITTELDAANPRIRAVYASTVVRVNRP